MPLTLMASLFWKPAVSEAEGAVPDSAVAPVIEAGVACWSFSDAPVTEPDVETRSGGWTAVMVVVVVVPDVVVVAVPAAAEKPKPASAARAVADEAETEKVAALGLLIVIAPPSMLEGVVVPVIVSIAESRLPTVPVVVLMT